MEISRRQLVAGGALAAGLTAMGTMGLAYASESTMSASSASASGSASASASTGSADVVATDQNADIVIIGEGMGGLTAGIRALEDGIKNVTVIEISKWPGGGSSFSLGAVHANGMGSSADMYMQNTRYQSTSQLAINSFLCINNLLDWLGTFDLPLEITDPADTDAQTGGSAADLKGGKMLNADGEQGCTAPINFFTAYEDLFTSMGGKIMHEVEGRHLVMTDDGKVSGVLCADKNGNLFTISTTQVVLACGGWQNDTELKSRYLGVEAWEATVLGTPYNTGTGIKMAQEIGASLQGDFGQFAGLFIPALPAKNWMEDVENYEDCDYSYDEGGKWWFWMEVIDALPTAGILVNCDGKRFCDEGRFRHSYEPEIARQKRATGILICDSTCWDAWAAAAGWGIEEGKTNQDRLDLITSDKIGGAYFQADTIEDLADQMNASGVATYAVHKANLASTIEEYNAAAEAGTGADLYPERVTNECTAISTPPFYALPLRNAIFANFGGVAIDEKARVLSAARKPIVGLYATEPCAGGMMQEFYAGSIAHAGVTGMWSADTAAEALGLTVANPSTVVPETVVASTSSASASASAAGSTSGSTQTAADAALQSGCGNCHSQSEYEGWGADDVPESVIKSMNSGLSDEDVATILDYYASK